MAQTFIQYKHAYLLPIHLEYARLSLSYNTIASARGNYRDLNCENIFTCKSSVLAITNQMKTFVFYTLNGINRIATHSYAHRHTILRYAIMSLLFSILFPVIGYTYFGQLTAFLPIPEIDCPTQFCH
jgi:hypothetical protein